MLMDISGGISKDLNMSKDVWMMIVNALIIIAFVGMAVTFDKWWMCFLSILFLFQEKKDE